MVIISNQTVHIFHISHSTISLQQCPLFAHPPGSFGDKSSICIFVEHRASSVCVKNIWVHAKAEHRWYYPYVFCEEFWWLSFLFVRGNHKSSQKPSEMKKKSIGVGVFANLHLKLLYTCWTVSWSLKCELLFIRSRGWESVSSESFCRFCLSSFVLRKLYPSVAFR